MENDIEEELFFYPAHSLVMQQFIKTVRAQNPLLSGSY